MLGAAFNDMAHMLVPDFIKSYRPNFPLGSAQRQATLEYLQHSAMYQLYVPITVFIDRKGVIKKQVLGDDAFFLDQEKNLRAAIEEMLKEPAVRKSASAAKK